MTRQKNAPRDIVLLGQELKERGFQVYAHKSFGGVSPTAHDPKGAHYANGGEAIDVGRDDGGPVSPSERAALDRLAVELDARRYAVIWNRGPNDHVDHLHAATGRWRTAVGYRFTLSGSRRFIGLNIDGQWGPRTWAGVAWALNREAPKKPGWNTAPDVVRPLQRVLRTETGSTRLEVDGRLGPATWAALGEVLGVKVPKQPTAAFASVTALLQVNVSLLGRVV